MRNKTWQRRRFAHLCRTFSWRPVALALAACALGTAIAAGTAGATLVVPSTQGFGYTSTPQFFTVPAGVSKVHITAWGGSGGKGGGGNGLYSAPGGGGGYVSLDASVSPGDTLGIYVGGEGGSASGSSSFGFEQTAGAGGGASGSNAAGGPGGNVNAPEDSAAGGGGGGGTTVIDGSTVLLVAAGGGGGGGGGRYPGYNGGGGGNSGSKSDSQCDPHEGAGYFGNGLTGGAGGACSQPGTGAEGISGSGETPGSGAGTGGGGGGGLIGGDGGADGGSAGGAGGGGGAGTSYWSSTSNALVSNGSPGSGGVVVSWSSAPTGVTPESRTFRCCEAQQFIVPAGVTQLQIVGSGGSGGFGGGEGSGFVAASGGYGAQISLIAPVSPGDQLQIDPGGAGGNGLFFDTGGEGARHNPIPGGAAGSSNSDQSGGSGGSDLMLDGNNAYVGGTGGGGGAGTEVIDQTGGNAVLLDAGGGGGAGGDSVAGPGDNGGPGGNAGSPIFTGNPADGDGFFGSGRTDAPTANGEGGLFLAGDGTLGANAPSTSSGVGPGTGGTGGGGGGGAIGSGAGQLCTTGGTDSCEGSGGGGAGASSTWSASATDVNVSNALEGPGAVTVSWLPPAPAAPTATITTPLPNKTYVMGAKVKTTFACAESAGGPGLESCTDSTGHSGTSGLLNTAAPGIYTYTVTAKSIDGQTATAQINYAVTVKGYTAYDYCGLVIGCGNVLLVDSTAKLWQLPQLGESGTIQTVAGKPKKTDFMVTSEFDKGCVYTSVKESTGYNSAANPGNWECDGVAIERWYASKL